jgi:hypothetical protein
MKVGFLNEPSDVLWLQETALKGITLPDSWKDFKSFVLQGNEDSPYAVNLYRSDDPHYRDNYFRVVFHTRRPDQYALGVEYSGDTDGNIGSWQAYQRKVQA